MNASHRDLADPQHWKRSLERSLHRRAIAPEVRRSVARRRRASVALTTLMAAGPTGGLLSAAGLGRGADVAQASPAARAIETTPATQTATMLRIGSRGSAVAEVQRELAIPVDGIFGPVTDAAVRDLQRREGLLVDGIVGPVTWTALFGLEQAAAAMAQTGDGNVAVIVRERTDVGAERHRHGTGGTAPAVGGGDTGPRPVARVDAPDPPRSAPVSRPAPDRGGACGALRLRTPVHGTVTSSFGPRWGRHHAGIDIAAPTGTPIRAAECGIVSFSGAQSGYGNMVCVKHSSRFETCYAHMTRSTVRSGQKVDKGNVIGYVGCTGSCTGPHVHFETRVDGTARDPRHYLAGGSVPGTPTVRAAVAGQTTTASIATATPVEAASGARAAAGIATTAGGATAPTGPAPEQAPSEAAPVESTAPETTVAPEATEAPALEPAPAPGAIAPEPEGVTEPASAPEPVAPEPAPEPVEPPTTTAPTAEVPTTPQPSPDPQPAPSPQPTPPPSPQPTPDPSPQPTPPAPEPIPSPDPVPEPTPDGE